MAELNTYDILKQRYLVLTREALAVLKDRVKQKPARRPIAVDRRRRGHPESLTPWSRSATPQYERSGPMLEPYQVILRPLVTEKGTHLSERHNAYAFEVHPLATKTEIKHAVETLFDVKVADVRTQNRKGKPRRTGSRSGRMRNWKKAIVELHDEDRIDFYLIESIGVVGLGDGDSAAETDSSID